MILPAFIAAAKTTFHGKLGLSIASALWVAFATVAVDEAFKGQLIISLITAVPPTGAVIIAAIAMLRASRKDAQAVLEGQAEMHKQMNSRLDELVEAKQGVAQAAGVEKERNEQRERTNAAAAAAAAIAAIPAQKEKQP